MAIVLSPTKYYHAFALYIIAKHKQLQVIELEKELNEILQAGINDIAGDYIYDPSKLATKEDFDSALKKMNIIVEWIKEEKEEKKDAKEG